MKQVFLIYPKMSLAVFLLSFFIVIITYTNPSFDDKLWSITAYATLLRVGLFIISIVLLLFRLLNTDIENSPIYFGLGLFNFLTSVPFIGWFNSKSMSVNFIIGLPIIVGLLILVDILWHQKKSV